MVSSRVRELWGVDFTVVPHGLAEEEVVDFVDHLISRSHDGGSDRGSHAALLKLAELTVVRADEVAESIKEEARQKAEAEAAQIRADAEEEARAQAHQLLATAQDEVTMANPIAVRAEQKAQQIIMSAQREAVEILQAAKQTASEAELLVRKLKDRLANLVVVRAIMARQQAARTELLRQKEASWETWE